MKAAETKSVKNGFPLPPFHVQSLSLFESVVSVVFVAILFAPLSFSSHLISKLHYIQRGTNFGYRMPNQISIDTKNITCPSAMGSLLLLKYGLRDGPRVGLTQLIAHHLSCLDGIHSTSNLMWVSHNPARLKFAS